MAPIATATRATRTPAVQARILSMRAMRWERFVAPFVPARPRLQPQLDHSPPRPLPQDTACMRTTRRRFLAAASATVTAAATPALAQSKETEAAGFEEALRTKFAAGDVLDW